MSMLVYLIYVVYADPISCIGVFILDSNRTTVVVILGHFHNQMLDEMFKSHKPNLNKDYHDVKNLFKQ